MATNPPSGDGHRNGAVKGRSQTFNPKTEQWVKRDSETGRFMDVKKDGTPFKGVRKEKMIIAYSEGGRVIPSFALIYTFTALVLSSFR